MQATCGQVTLTIATGPEPTRTTLATLLICGVAPLPLGPVGPVGPSGPVGPVPPVGPVGPVPPVGPVEPVEPVDPVEPVAPVEPSLRWAPVDPVDPVAPVSPRISGRAGRPGGAFDPVAGQVDFTPATVEYRVSVLAPAVAGSKLTPTLQTCPGSRITLSHSR